MYQKFYPTLVYQQYVRSRVVTKTILRVPGRPPTLASFRSRFHMASTNGIFRYFFKSRDEDDSSPSWIEITDPNEPLPTVKNGANNQDETIVEAKVIQG